MLTADFDYELDQGLIAQSPRLRGTTRLLVLDRGTGSIEHRRVADVVGLLRRGDLLLINDTRVIPARLWARRPTGRRFELLLLRPLEGACWEAMLRPSARAREGERLALSDGGAVIPRERLGEGAWRVELDPPLDDARLEGVGETPLPPYIERPEGATVSDRTDYQTVYARNPGAVAAPTAGLHLTPELLDDIRSRGVGVETVTLHVGVGTFRPVKTEQVEDHRMHSEAYEVEASTAATINRTLSRGERVVCVGTTTVRTIEAALACGAGLVRPGPASTNLFISPPHRFRGVGALLTNFHLPRSSLLMLVSALAGREFILRAYREAMAERYRVFSYGDAMFIA